MDKIEIIVIGAGGLGREVAAMLINHNEYQHIGFIDDNLEAGSTVNGIEVLGGLAVLEKDAFQNKAVVLGIGSPKVKKLIIDKCSHLNLQFPNIIHPQVLLQNPDYISMGKGNVVCAGNILTTNIEIGDFNLVNLSCTIGHDAKIANYCSIMPGVNISGGADIKDCAYIGTGAKLIKSTIIGENSIVGAGAVIHTDVDPDSTYVGVPGKKI